MTTLAELRTAVNRDIRDPGGKTFIPAVVDDLINAGMEEVSRVYPREVIVTFDATASSIVYDPATLSLPKFTGVFRVLLLRNDAFYFAIESNTGDGQMDGYEVWDGIVRLPVGSMTSVVTATDTLEVWGYAARARLTADAQVAEIDTTAEMAVRAYCKAEAFVLMDADRALYRQWQAQSNNSDVSATQLTQMASLYTDRWDKIRNQIRRLRRV